MTNKQSKLFTKIVDTNWEVKVLFEAGKFNQALSKKMECNALIEELKDDMGHREYEKMINQGREMFAMIKHISAVN
jgi:hypothetical protein